MALSRRGQLKAISAIRGAKLLPREIEAEKLLRISAIRHVDGLGFTKNAESRFSDPQAAAGKATYGVIYLSTDFATCVAETIVRDGKDGVPGLLPRSRKEAVDDWQVFEPQSVKPLRLVNLSSMGIFWHGIPSDILRGSDHEMAEKLSRAIHQNAGAFDGILYQSRFLMGECIAVFDRAIPKLHVVKSVPLSKLTGNLKPVFKGMGLKIVR
jgi:RES domain